jgi:hypothetical protein
VEPRLLLSSTAAPTAARDAHQSRVAWHAPHPLLPSVRGCEWGSNPLGGSLYSLLNKPIQRWTGARAGEVSEAAAVKARWLGNFCPRQPVHRALKRQQQPRPLSAAPGSSALIRPGPAREFKTTSSGLSGPLRSGPPAQTTRSSQGSTLPHRGRPASQVHRSRTGSACNIHAISPLRRVLRSSIGRPPLGSPSYKLGFIGATQARPACFK